MPDPVEAYDRIAPEYGSIAGRRKAFLDGVDELVVCGIAPGSRSILDVGAGDGRRAMRIAGAAGIGEITLLEPSSAMRRCWPAGVRGLALRAEDLGSLDGEFDAILCLWNVLGHIFPAQNRIRVLSEFARLVSPRGRVFVDVSHRYNARHYGVLPTVCRLIRDAIGGGERNGDVEVRWGDVRTRGHVFRDGEFRRAAMEAGLAIENRHVIDYESGAVRRWAWQGHLLYIMRRQPR